jgi:hypothetical protein
MGGGAWGAAWGRGARGWAMRGAPRTRGGAAGGAPHARLRAVTRCARLRPHEPKPRPRGAAAPRRAPSRPRPARERPPPSRSSRSRSASGPLRLGGGGEASALAPPPPPPPPPPLPPPLLGGAPAGARDGREGQGRRRRGDRAQGIGGARRPRPPAPGVRARARARAACPARRRGHGPCRGGAPTRPRAAAKGPDSPLLNLTTNRFGPRRCTEAILRARRGYGPGAAPRRGRSPARGRPGGSLRHGRHYVTRRAGLGPPRGVRDPAPAPASRAAGGPAPSAGLSVRPFSSAPARAGWGAARAGPRPWPAGRPWGPRVRGNETWTATATR